MSRIEELRVSGQILFLVVAGAAAQTLCAGGAGHALGWALSPPPSQGYLLRVGPPNLRFESGQVHEPIAPTQYSLAKSSPLKIAVATASAGKAVDTTNNFPIPTQAALVTSEVTKADSTPAPASFSALSLEPGGTDSSIVTPAMLADYLKPSASGKASPNNNDGSSRGVAPLNPGFTPPRPAAAHQSHAVYKNE